MKSSGWVDDANAALLTDLYELTMLQGYFDRGMSGVAVFDLFVRRLPSSRNYLLACGLEHVLAYLETVSFSPDALDYLRSLNRFSLPFLDHLSGFRFTGDVYAVPEGSVVFANEPLLEVIAPLPEAQLVETFLLNQIQFPTLAASKAARVVSAAEGRTVVDYGLRRIHGADAGLKAARAFYIAGVSATSNVLAGKMYGIPVAGTMAHSYVQAFDNELDAFRSFVRSYPTGTLLVDTYDTIKGIHHVIQLSRELGENFRVDSVRLDSGDLNNLSREVRSLLDTAGLQKMKIFASSSLDEYAVEKLVLQGAPIDGFGVGVNMGTSEDAPFLDVVYKLVEYAGKSKMKLSQEKATLPGRKQVFRQTIANAPVRDVIACGDENLEGVPLLTKVMEGGRRLHPIRSLEEIRRECRNGLATLNDSITAIEPAGSPYLVVPSPGLLNKTSELRASLIGLGRVGS